jgi:hypothetical protein
MQKGKTGVLKTIKSQPETCNNDLIKTWTGMQNKKPRAL